MRDIKSSRGVKDTNNSYSWDDWFGNRKAVNMPVAILVSLADTHMYLSKNMVIQTCMHGNQGSALYLEHCLGDPTRCWKRAGDESIARSFSTPSDEKRQRTVATSHVQLLTCHLAVWMIMQTFWIGYVFRARVFHSKEQCLGSSIPVLHTDVVPLHVPWARYQEMRGHIITLFLYLPTIA